VGGEGLTEGLVVIAALDAVGETVVQLVSELRVK
jgi:hypothetical protein